MKYLLDGEHQNWRYDGYTDTGQDTEGRASDQLVGVLQGLLEGGDGEESQVLLFFSVAHQIHIHQLLDLPAKTKGTDQITLSRGWGDWGLLGARGVEVNIDGSRGVNNSITTLLMSGDVHVCQCVTLNKEIELLFTCTCRHAHIPHKQPAPWHSPLTYSPSPHIPHKEP